MNIMTHSNPLAMNLHGLTSLRGNITPASQLLKTLGNPDRLLLLCKLAEGEMNVGELEESLQIVQPTLSQQLGVLRREGLVGTRRDGRQMFYRIGNSSVLVMLQTLCHLHAKMPE